MHMHARAGESDRAIKVKMVSETMLIISLVADHTPQQPKHLLAGKRKMGKTDRP